MREFKYIKVSVWARTRSTVVKANQELILLIIIIINVIIIIYLYIYCGSGCAIRYTGGREKGEGGDRMRRHVIDCALLKRTRVKNQSTEYVTIQEK